MYLQDKNTILKTASCISLQIRTFFT